MFYYTLRQSSAMPAILITPRILEGDNSALWWKVLRFYLLNYAAHIASITHPVGVTVSGKFVPVVLAFLFPYSGIWQAVRAISRCSNFGGNSVDRAMRAGALCVVGIKDGPNHAIIPKDDNGNPDFYLLPPGTLVAGLYKLPNGYGLYGLTDVVNVKTKFPVEHRMWRSARIDNVRPRPFPYLKLGLSLLHLVSAAITLYETTDGPQIDLFGYAAFGLTVIPYITMSLWNIVSLYFTPEHSHYSLVSSQMLNTASELGGQFEGTMGELVVGNRRFDDL
jgi:hypothetical protein